MKALIFTNDNGPDSRALLEIGSQLEFEKYQVIYYLWEDEEAARVAELYDIYSPPAVVVVRDDGSYIECWQSEIPLLASVRSRVANG